MIHFENSYKGRGAILSPSFKKGGGLVACNLIRGGFSFRGVDIADLGLSYIPELEDMYVYGLTESDVHEETFDGHDGGYYYGCTDKPKEFVLKCYFENSLLDSGIMEKIYTVFRTGQQGKLIFDRRPWCYYLATVTSSPKLEPTNPLNGTITFNLKAYYPYSRSDLTYASLAPADNIKLLNCTGFFVNSGTVPTTSFTNITTTRTVLLHNAGTKRAPLSISIAGNAGDGVIIENLTNGQSCKIVGMDNAHTVSASKHVYIDGINGTTSLTDGSTFTPAYYYHDEGYITLEPAYPIIRDVVVISSNNDTIELSKALIEDVEGQYIYLSSNWRKIKTKIDNTHLKLYNNITISSSQNTTITKMNEIQIRPIDTMNISTLSFHFKPTFA